MEGGVKKRERESCRAYLRLDRERASLKTVSGKNCRAFDGDERRRSTLIPLFHFFPRFFFKKALKRVRLVYPPPVLLPRNRSRRVTISRPPPPSHRRLSQLLLSFSSFFFFSYKHFDTWLADFTAQISAPPQSPPTPQQPAAPHM